VSGKEFNLIVDNGTETTFSDGVLEIEFQIDALEKSRIKILDENTQLDTFWI